MSRPVYLIVYHSPIFAAHWALWAPNTEKEGDGKMGKIINVQGSPSEGFIHEFERNYDLSTETRSHSLRLLCEINKELVLENDDAYSNDDIPRDKLEELARKVEAPGPSLRPPGSKLKTRIKIENCQTWLLQFVSLLVKEGVFPKEALMELERAPKN